MKLGKLVASIAASAVAVTSLAAVSSAYDAWLMFGDADWSYQCMAVDSYPAGHVDITSDGTYTVKAGGAVYTDDETGDEIPAEAEGTIVFCVDIDGLAEGFGIAAQKGDDAMQIAKDAGVTVSDVSITLKNSDGSSSTVAVDDSKIIFGDIENKGTFRIELYNEYGAGTATDSPFSTSDIAFDDEIAVTFTISGLGGGAAAADTATTDTAADTVAETTTAAAGDVAAATDSSKGSPDTGIADVAAVAGLAVVAAGAVVVAKKRK